MPNPLDATTITTTGKQTMSEELLPCPCCAGKGVLINENSVWYSVRCAYCGMQTNSHPQPDWAIKTWNTRPNSKPYKYETCAELEESVPPEVYEHWDNDGRDHAFNAAREKR